MHQVRRLWLAMALVSLAACVSPVIPMSPVTPSPIAISCQPFGYTPAPIAFSFAPGPVTAQVAEETSVALFRACELPGAAITGLTSSSTASTGVRGGPNEGQPVWLVRVDATVAEPSSGASYESHFLIEVNQATGAPTIQGQG